MIKKVKIEEVATIRFGLYAEMQERGSVEYLQARHFSNNGIKNEKIGDFINLEKKSEAHLLKDGEVLFAGKGNKLFAWCYRENKRPAVASSIFFVLTINTNIVFPEYLTAILNAPQSKASFLQIGSGTNILSIRKSELGAFEIPLPPIQQQKKIAAIAQLHQQEIELFQQIIDQKQNLYKSIISKLIK